MRTLSYLKRITSFPPKIILQKLFLKTTRRIRNATRKWQDWNFSTYESDCVQLNSLPQFMKPVELSSIPNEGILKLCEHYLHHEFDLLGSGWVKVFPGMDCLGINGIKYSPTFYRGLNKKNRIYSSEIQALIRNEYQPIDWQIDFKSGYRWQEDILSQDIKYGIHKGADIKVPWELARMQHLAALAWGYALEKKPKYLFEFQNQILDFIASNPPRYGVNWVCTMDVGIRIANWLFAYDLFRAYGAKFKAPFEKIFFQSVYEHGKHIYTHLEWDPSLRMNHYLANIAGLLFVGVYLNNPIWLEFAFRELKSETLSQFNQDGSNFEGSTSYHRLSSEMVLYATALAQEIGLSFPNEHFDRMHKMADFIRDITKPDGMIVQFGDNDSGRFLKVFPESNELDHRYLIPALRDCKNLTSIIQKQLIQSEKITEEKQAIPDFGLYILTKGAWFLAIRCGPLGQKGDGGHSHNDQLSFELAVNGISMIIDPGTYVYSPFPEERNKFRATSSHNTLCVEGLEQNEEEGLFLMPDRARGVLVHFQDGFFSGEHRGFGPIHRRTISLHQSMIKGIDECDASNKRIYFHFAPNTVVNQLDEGLIEVSSDSVVLHFSADSGIFEIEKGEYSSGYGKKITIEKAVLQAPNRQTRWSITLLSDQKNSQEN